MSCGNENRLNVRTLGGAAVLTTLALLGVARGDNPTKHWAYVAPQRSELPTLSRPSGARQPIDYFVQQRLEQEGLQPAKEADRRTLIRRVTFDLTGLPPTPAEVTAFLDDQSPDAYERLIDRLLASPRYGERMAVDWLDLARYADTHGYHSDSQRHMWRWRDWVIESLNTNMPFDQFTVEQLAGDLLPGATLEQRLATGLHRNHMLNDENGAIPEEYLAEYVAERASTTATIWLGQTLACARCHDHKHDPFTQRDFYQLYAFFHNVPENGLGGRNGNAPPVLSVPTRQQRGELQSLTRESAQLQSQMAARAAAAEGDLSRWQTQLASAAESLNQPPGDALLHLRLDEGAGDVASAASEQKLAAKLRGNPTWIDGKFGQALLCDGETSGELPLRLADSAAEAFTLAAWIFPTTSDTLPILSRLDDTQYRRGFEWGLTEGKPFFRLTHSADSNEFHLRARQPLPLRRWQHVAVSYDGSGRAAGVALFVDGQPLKLETVTDKLTAHVATDQPLRLAQGDSETYFRGLLDDIQVFTRALTADDLARLAGGDPIRAIAQLPRQNRTGEQQAELRRYYLEHVDAAYGRLQQEQRRVQRRLGEIERQAPTTMVMAELPEPRSTHILVGGRYDELGAKVIADTPASLPKLSDSAPRNRLGLARWLTEPNHPLTARVAVNRYWQTLFGAGLVRTPDDFGNLGDKPTHPLLLDWLAREFVDSGWDVKRVQRLLVTSTTYRQNSLASEQLLTIDPDNRLLARGPRQRLSAEALRDAALQSAGLLQTTIGGPSVRPYQPAELWRELAYDPTEYSAQVFQQSTGADLYRRSFYTFWKRSVPPPNLSLLDAPDRETCTTGRTLTSTPLQALVLLNDTTFVEAARTIAQRAISEGPADSSGRIDFAFQHVLSRPATPNEAESLIDLLRSQQNRYAADLRAARVLLEVGDSPVRSGIDPAEFAAWTNVVTVILNLDEAVTKR